MRQVLFLHYLLCVSFHGCVCSQGERTPIHKQLPEMPPSSLFTFCILSAALIQKNRALRMTDHRRLWRELPLHTHTPTPPSFALLSFSFFPSPRKVSLFTRASLPPPNPSPLHQQRPLLPSPGWREWPQNARCITE